MPRLAKRKTATALRFPLRGPAEETPSPLAGEGGAGG